MSFFELGYFGMIYVILTSQNQILPILTGVIFLMGAIFVLLVVTMGARTCQLLKDSNEALEGQMKILKTRNNQLVQFNYATTHDLREPINTVLGCAAILEADYHHLLDENGQKLIDFTKKAGHRMSELVSALSDYLSIGIEFKRESVDVKNLINEVIDSMNGSVHSTDTTFDIGPMPIIYANKHELKRVFQNLISNSIKYKRKDVAPNISVSAKKKGGKWLFALRDNGMGISQKDIPRAFQLFRQLHSNELYEGMGLGLSITRRVVELHGGKIWLESEVGQGTTFYFTLANNCKKRMPNKSTRKQKLLPTFAT